MACICPRSKVRVQGHVILDTNLQVGHPLLSLQKRKNEEVEEEARQKRMKLDIKNVQEMDLSGDEDNSEWCKKMATVTYCRQLKLLFQISILTEKL